MHLKIDAGEIINIAFTKKSFKSNKFSDALAFLALMTITGLLTDSLKLENGHFVCLAVLALPLSYSIRLAKIYIFCTLHNFQFYLAHLWTDFQSCFNPTDTIIVTLTPQIGEGSGFDSQGSVTLFNKYCFPNLHRIQGCAGQPLFQRGGAKKRVNRLIPKI